MGTTLNRESYKKLIEQDVVWLCRQTSAQAIERRHIIDVLYASIDLIYDSPLTPSLTGKLPSDQNSEECDVCNMKLICDVCDKNPKNILTPWERK